MLKIKTVEKHQRKQPNFWGNTELNIKIDANNNIKIYNNLAKTSLGADLLLRGTVADPVVFGRVETDRGLIYFRNNEFRIIHASADLSDPEKFNPYFDITAESSVQGYEINIAIEGYLDQFDMTLVSDPPLEENEILALLTFGEVGSESQGLDSGVTTAEATGFLTGKYQDVIEDRLTMITGFDRFMIEPYVSKKTGTIGPRLTVSKRLIGEKFFISYSSAVGVFEEDTMKLEYEFDKHTSLIAGRDETGLNKAGMRFRFEFK